MTVIFRFLLFCSSSSTSFLTSVVSFFLLFFFLLPAVFLLLDGDFFVLFFPFRRGVFCLDFFLPPVPLLPSLLDLSFFELSLFFLSVLPFVFFIRFDGEDEVDFLLFLLLLLSFTSINFSEAFYLTFFPLLLLVLNWRYVNLETTCRISSTTFC